METKGLFEAPRFNDPDYYLTSGMRTQVTERVLELANSVEGETDRDLAMNMLVAMKDATEATRLISGGKYPKFKRSADNILEQKVRIGCSDSSTLYATLLRARGIPTMQVITFCVPEAVRRPETFTYGHFYVAAYLKDGKDKPSWEVIDPDVDNANIDWKHFEPLDEEDRNIDPYEYAFAYARDYSDVDYFGRKFNSERMMIDLQRLAFALCNKRDMTYVQRIIREHEERERRAREEAEKGGEER